MARVLGTLEVRTCIFHLSFLFLFFLETSKDEHQNLSALGRLIKLLPEDTEDAELTAIKKILNYRLPPNNDEARIEWLSIIEGTHYLWKGVRSEVPPEPQNINYNYIPTTGLLRKARTPPLILHPPELGTPKTPTPQVLFQFPICLRRKPLPDRCTYLLRLFRIRNIPLPLYCRNPRERASHPCHQLQSRPSHRCGTSRQYSNHRPKSDLAPVLCALGFPTISSTISSAVCARLRERNRHQR